MAFNVSITSFSIDASKVEVARLAEQLSVLFQKRSLLSLGQLAAALSISMNACKDLPLFARFLVVTIIE